jgi:catechol 2,3-dioxygenase
MTDHTTSTQRHRLPDATHVGGVSLQVSDLDRSLAYYTDVLGFRVLERDAHRALLGAQGSDAPLVTLHERKGARHAARAGRLGLYHFAILLPDRASLGRFITHLAEIGARAGAADHLVSEALYLHDPDGLGIEVYADRPRSTWKRNGDEVAMDTLPLDMQSLVREAQGEPWTGMPPGTTVGHVHLHVGDIERAHDFYSTALGFDPMVRSYPGALFLAAGGYHHHLGLNTWAGPGAQPSAPDDARLLEWEIVVPTADDVRATARNMEHGGHSGEFAGDDWRIVDPWGTMLRLTPERAR